MSRRSRASVILQWVLLLALLAVALWRGHHLIERGSHPPPPTPRPRPREIAVVITVEGLAAGDLDALAAALEERGWTACSALLPESEPAAALRRAVRDSGAAPLHLRVASRDRADPVLPGEITLRHAEAPEAVLEARRILDRAGPPPPAVWLELRDLAIPPPRLRAARRDLRWRGLTLPSRPVLRRWLRAPAGEPENAGLLLGALHRRGLENLRRGVSALLSGGHRWLPSVVVLLAAGGTGNAGTPALAARPGPVPPPCPSLEEVAAVLTGQKTWPSPR